MFNDLAVSKVQAQQTSSPAMIALFCLYFITAASARRASQFPLALIIDVFSGGPSISAQLSIEVICPN
jgi:hypothetical protein